METTYLLPVIRPSAPRRAVRIAAPVEVTCVPSGYTHKSCLKQCGVYFLEVYKTLEVCLVPLP